MEFVLSATVVIAFIWGCWVGASIPVSSYQIVEAGAVCEKAKSKLKEVTPQGNFKCDNNLSGSIAKND